MTMNIFFKTLFRYGLIGTLLAGCGSQEQSLANAGLSASPPLPTVFKGQVVGQNGAAEPGVQIVVHERTTNAKVEGVSGADGSFSLDLPPGVYDLGLDRPGDGQTATCFYGPLISPAREPGKFVLRDAQGLPAKQVFGKLWLSPGVAAVNRSLTLRPGVRHSGVIPLPGPKTSTTAADGSFTLQLDSAEEVSFDVEVSDATGALDEWIDVGKRSKPCYVEFATEQSEIENRLHCNESELNDLELVPPVRTNATSGAVGTSSSKLIPFRGSLFNPDPNTQIAELLHGQLPISKTVYNLPDIADLSAFHDAWKAEGDLLRATSIKVDSNGSWWWKYAVNILPQSSEAGSSYWSFVDGGSYVAGNLEPDKYELSVYRYGRWHKVSYNSDVPHILEIDLTFNSGL